MREVTTREAAVDKNPEFGRQLAWNFSACRGVYVSAFVRSPLSHDAGKTEHMPDDTLVRKLSDLDLLLNDPDVPMEPMLIWRLASEIAKHEVSAAAPPGIQDTGFEY